MHVHVSSPEGEAKFWLEPVITLADYYNLTPRQLKEIQHIVEEKTNEIKKIGKSTSKVEINSSPFGIWLLVYDTEYFLPYKDYPWFLNAKISGLYNVELLHGTHLHWPDLDVDLDLDSLIHPEKYPLVYLAH